MLEGKNQQDFSTSTFRLALDDVINDSDSYCACVVVNFSDNRHKNRLVEIHLNCASYAFMSIKSKSK